MAKAKKPNAPASAKDPSTKSQKLSAGAKIDPPSKINVKKASSQAKVKKPRTPVPVKGLSTEKQKVIVGAKAGAHLDNGTNKALSQAKGLPSERPNLVRNLPIRKVGDKTSSLKLGSVDYWETRQWIALLYMVNEKPKPPAENCIITYQKKKAHQRMQALTISREKELAETLAFLAYVDDDPRKVVAVCIEEGLDHQGLTIRIAANHGDAVNVSRGLEDIAQILEKVAQTEQGPDVQANLIRSAVCMNQNRILCRLRSIHATSKAKSKKAKSVRPKSIPYLSEILSATHNSAGVIRADVDTLQLSFSQLESMNKDAARSEPGLALLILLVETAHGLTHRVEWTNLSRTSFGSGLQSVEKHLRIVEKLGRYASAAVNLYQAARRYSCFSEVQVNIVKLHAPVKPKYDPSERIKGRPAAFSPDKEDLLKLVSYLKGHRKSNIGEVADVEETLWQTVAADCAVHAEIQLLFYYEVHQPATYPRVICSSKKACFLCNLFFHLHGQFFIPSTHGTLYEKWIVPACINDLKGPRAEAMASVMTSFIKVLKDETRTALSSRHKRLPGVTESAVFQSVIWTLSDRSASKLASLNGEVPEPATESQEKTPRQETPSVVRDHSSFILGQETTTSGSLQGQDALANPSAPVSATELCDERHVENDRVYRLTESDTIQVELTGLIRVETPRIHMTLTFDSRKGDGNAKRRLAKLTRLDPEECARKLEEGFNVVDVGLLRENGEVTVNQYLGTVFEGLRIYRKPDMILLQCWEVGD